MKSSLLFAIIYGVLVLNTYAEVQISHAWIKPSRSHSNVSSAYMVMKSDEDVTLTTVTSDVAGSVEIHSMLMQGGVMKMRMLNSLALPKSKEIVLAPSGIHLMFFDVKRPLKLGEKVSLNLYFHSSDKQPFQQKVEATVQAFPDENTPKLE